MRELLLAAGVSSSAIDDIIAAGYFTWQFLGSGEMLCDPFYGNKGTSGLFTAEAISRFLNTGKRPAVASVPEFTVSSIGALRDSLAKVPQLNRFHSSGLMTFRGQRTEHFAKRPFANPVQSDARGMERLILPSHWRQFRDNWEARTDPPVSIFRTILGDELIYRGIKNWQTLGEINSRRYGSHTMSDLEDFPDAESREYGRRWRMFKVEGGWNSELGIVEQHYGAETNGLDVTFDPAVAGFFATHDFQRTPTGSIQCRPSDNSLGAVVYAFVFHDPSVKRTHDLITSLRAFDHASPERPRRQQCALRGFDRTQINQAVTDLAAVFHLAPGFSGEGLPPFEELFPRPEEDPFYSAVLELKKARATASVNAWDWVAEYDYS